MATIFQKLRRVGRFKQMRNAIDQTELALNELQIDKLVKDWSQAGDEVYVRVRLGTLRRLAACYPELNRIINDERFNKE
jgi:hypothetical protein